MVVKPEFYENYDLTNIVTPIRVHEFERLLLETNYDRNKMKKLVEGFSQGFDLGYEGDPHVKLRSINLKFKGVGNNTILWNKVMKEVKLGRYAGPYSEVPFEYFI